MTERRSLVSVLVCVYNAGPFLRASVLSVLAQSYADIEVLIIDDGSTDRCMETIADLSDERLRVFHQSNRGKPAAMNRALAEARGTYYAVHDADDLSYPNRIEAQVSALEANPDLAAVFCGHDLIIDDRRMAPLAVGKDRHQCRADVARCLMPAHDPTGMYRLSLVGALGYEESLPVVEGYDHVLRVGERFPMLVVDGCHYGYRIHRASVTHRDPARRQELMKRVLLRACERRGQDPATRFPQLFGPGASTRPDPDNNLAGHFTISTMEQRRLGRRAGAFKTALDCVRVRPTAPKHYRPLACAVLPRLALERLRRSRATASEDHATDGRTGPLLPAS